MDKQKKYKVLITTSGVGQRLGDLTKYTNKALVRIGKKPVISYIIEAYPKNTHFVITLGYFGNQVRDFLELAYPQGKFTFVNVDRYQGEGSSLGYSMLQARDQLQCPFIFHCNDTIVKEKIPIPVRNWNGGIKGEDASSFSSFQVVEGIIQEIKIKGAKKFDYLHIGLVGIKDYKEFWEALESEYQTNPKDSALNDCRALNILIKNGKHFFVKEFKSWFDTGSPETLKKTKENIGDKFQNLDKNEESIFIFKNFVIKFFYDQSLVKDKVIRAGHLKDLVPDIEGIKENFFRYKYIHGDLYSRSVTPSDFTLFLDWCKQNLWIEAKEMGLDQFKKICFDFYYNKTKQRAEKLMTMYSIKDDEDIINDEQVPSLEYLFDNIDFNWLSNAKQTMFHGDLILDNIIKGKNGYKLIDWRQNFSGSLKVGDMYYDLSKLNHNLTINHDIVNDNLFMIDKKRRKIKCDIHRKNNLIDCQKTLFGFLKKEKLDSKKVEIITPLIWLSSSPLHHYPYNLFLFYFGKLNLWRAIKNHKGKNER